MTIRIFVKDNLIDYIRVKDIYNVENLSEMAGRYYFKCSDRKEEFYWTKESISGLPQIVE